MGVLIGGLTSATPSVASISPAVRRSMRAGNPDLSSSDDEACAHLRPEVQDDEEYMDAIEDEEHMGEEREEEQSAAAGY
jgi:hypothetical protein